jgi:hypothetical protein
VDDNASIFPNISPIIGIIRVKLEKLDVREAKRILSPKCSIYPRIPPACLYTTPIVFTEIERLNSDTK